MPSTEEQQRRPRFERSADQAVLITDRDVEIIRQVWKHRFLRSTHLEMLIGGSEQQLRRRLNLLYHNGYLDRPLAQLDYYARAGSQPMVYGVGNRGADLLLEKFKVHRGKIDWTEKNHSTGRVFINHTLLVADVMVRLEVSCRTHGAVRLIEPNEILENAPEATRRRRHPFRWNVTFRHENERCTVGLIPDKVCGLHFTDAEDGRNRAYFFLEADRATMPVVRKRLAQTSVFKKQLSYFESWKQGLHTANFGFRNCRTLFVTSSSDRTTNLIQANKRVNGGEGTKLFLFADIPSLFSHDALTYGWRSGHDEKPIQLIE